MVHDGAEKRTGVAGDCIRGKQDPASPTANPLPVMEMAAPVVPELGVRTIVGVGTVTVNGGSEISPVLPLTWTRYVPGVAAAATVNPLPTKLPAALITHVGAPIMIGAAGDCKKVHVPSAVLNPLPVAET
jgi:hypothetical protein